jgi:hypothetical protein
MLAAIRAFVLVVYWGTAVLLLYFAISRCRSWTGRAVWAAIIVALFSAYPAHREYEVNQYKREKDAVLAHFKKRCTELAGEKIERVVENVQGLYLERPRGKVSEESLRDQFWMGDPYGYSDYEAANPTATYLYDRSGKTISERVLTPIKGFSFVETPNPEFTEGSGQPRYLRYTLQREHVQAGSGTETRFVAVAKPAAELKSRYGVTWADISTPDDRQHWVAGGSLTIFEVATRKIIAERIGYVVDPHMGAGGVARAIWVHVNHIQGAFCPPFENDFHKNKEFIAKVLKPPIGGANGR